jgi:hypothetical protein
MSREWDHVNFRTLVLYRRSLAIAIGTGASVWALGKSIRSGISNDYAFRVYRLGLVPRVDGHLLLNRSGRGVGLVTVISTRAAQGWNISLGIEDRWGARARRTTGTRASLYDIWGVLHRLSTSRTTRIRLVVSGGDIVGLLRVFYYRIIRDRRWRGLYRSRGGASR